MKAKKHLGQHFLTSKQALRDLLHSAAVTKGDSVLEIGPGKGVLTQALLGAGANVIAVETDEELVAELQEQLHSDHLHLIHEDALDITLSDSFFNQFNTSSYKVIANIPYYITGELLRRFLTAEKQPESVTVLIQKEVAERIARSKKESILSLSVKAYGVPRYVSSVPARYFNPAPQVDSAILHVAHISRSFFDTITEERFFKVVKAGFASKRKKLINNLSTFGSKEKLQKAFVAAGISPDARAEDIPLATWKELALALS